MVQHSLRRPTHFALRLALIMVMMMVGGGHLTPVESQQEQAWQILNIQGMFFCSKPQVSISFRLLMHREDSWWIASFGFHLCLSVKLDHFSVTHQVELLI